MNGELAQVQSGGLQM